MLIECGPTTLLRGRDWWVNGWRTDNRHGHYVNSFNASYLQYGSQRYRQMVYVAARAYGFVVDIDGMILNWDAVPHLWEHRDVD